MEPAWCTNFLNVFIAFLYMFRATMRPSSGENTVPMRLLVFVTLYRWLSGMQGGMNFALHTRQSSIESDKYQESHRYGIFSWWWSHSCPKHVEKSNKHIKKICAPNCFYLQDYTRMHGQQNIKKKSCCLTPRSKTVYKVPIVRHWFQPFQTFQASPKIHNFNSPPPQDVFWVRFILCAFSYF